MALTHFHDQRADIEARVWEAIQKVPIQRENLAVANLNLGRNIAAALTLGNVAFLGADLSWVEGLLANYHIPPELLGVYLSTYHEAAARILDERGKLLLDWLEDFCKEIAK
jgi:hypothetical protein